MHSSAQIVKYLTRNMQRYCLWFQRDICSFGQFIACSLIAILTLFWIYLFYLSMGASLTCCNTLTDQTNCKEFFMANSSPHYLPLLTPIVNTLPLQKEDFIRGDWEQGQHQTGSGIIYSPGKFYYEGGINDSQADGRGKIVWQSRLIYEGSIVNNKANGQGILRFPEDEAVLKGQWTNGEPTLHSKMYFSSKNQKLVLIIQEIRRQNGLDGKQGGIESLFVQMEFEGGPIYEGQVRRKKDSFYKIEGRGKLRFADGSEYQGQFQNGKMHGKGRYSWAQTGHWFEGEYKFNFRDGAGTYYYNQHRSKSGIWRGGQLQPESIA